MKKAAATSPPRTPGQQKAVMKAPPASTPSTSASTSKALPSTPTATASTNAPPSTPSTKATPGTTSLPSEMSVMTLDEKIAKREHFKVTLGSDSKEYKTWNSGVQAHRTPTEKKSEYNKRAHQKRLQAEAARAAAAASTDTHTVASIDGSSWTQNVHKFKFLDISATATNEINFAVFGGKAIRRLKLPTEEDFKALYPGAEPKPKIVEGALLSYKYNFADELDDITKNKIVSVIGKGFASPHNDEADPYFSYGDASVAHHLLFRYNRDTKATLAVQIFYTFKEKNSNREKRGIAGAMIFSRDLTVTKPDGTRFYKKTFCAYNLVQLTILQEYASRALGMLSVHIIPEIMNDVSGDFVFWAGCSRQFYEKCGVQSDLMAFDCPFDLADDESSNREMFFFMDPKKNSIDESKFQKEVLDVYKSGQARFKISYNDDVLKTYYGLDEADQNSRHPSRPKVVKKPERELEDPIVYCWNVLTEEGDEESNLIVDIENYPFSTWKLQVVGAYLLISSSRKTETKEYGFEVIIKFATGITEQSLKQFDFLEESSELYCTFNCKAVLVNNKEVDENGIILNAYKGS